MKKKLIALLCTVTLLLTSVPIANAAQATPQPTRPVQITDVLDILKCLVGIIDPLPLTYDFNVNGVIDTGDALEGLKSIVGLREVVTLPVALTAPVESEIDFWVVDYVHANDYYWRMTTAGTLCASPHTVFSEEFFEEDVTKLFLIQSYEEWQTYNTNCVCKLEDVRENLFENKSLVVINTYHLSNSMYFIVDSLEVKGNDLIVNSTITQWEGGWGNAYRIILAVNNADIEKINKIRSEEARTVIPPNGRNAYFERWKNWLEDKMLILDECECGECSECSPFLKELDFWVVSYRGEGSWGWYHQDCTASHTLGAYRLINCALIRTYDEWREYTENCICEPEHINEELFEDKTLVVVHVVWFNGPTIIVIDEVMQKNNDSLIVSMMTYIGGQRAGSEARVILAFNQEDLEGVDKIQIERKEFPRSDEPFFIMTSLANWLASKKLPCKYGE